MRVTFVDVIGGVIRCSFTPLPTQFSGKKMHLLQRFPHHGTAEIS